MIKNDQPPEGEALRIERLIERVKQWGYPVQLAAGGVVIPKPQPTGVVNPRPQRADSVWIEPGTFLMGCSPGDRECDSDERNPPVRTTIAKGFWLKKTEVTQAEFQRVMGSNPSHIKGPNRPVESVTWHEAADYCRKVGGRLPTAAEWEYAARAGTPGPTYGELDAIAWYRDNSKSGTHDVATKQPNGWGLYDMLGNVWEWVSDNYDSNSRELRGGSWYSFSLVTRASNRSRVVPGDRNLTDGFRCSRDD
ncbi:MAG: formylglycine-generating enzyme family protein [Acidobacteria bacterium]|nr:formylglycine-generating enzyme family protein [Acidobacteriota bacterium]